MYVCLDDRKQIKINRLKIAKDIKKIELHNRKLSKDLSNNNFGE
jgi:hypothetical protein